MIGLSAGDDGFVHSHDRFGVALPVEPLRVAEAGGAQPGGVTGIGYQPPQRGGDLGDVERILRCPPL
jgi:hypothetical protein